MSDTSISPEEVEAVMAEAFPAGFLAKANKRVPLSQAVESFGPLGSEHLAALQTHLDGGEPIGVNTVYTLKSLRHTHHRLAQLLAGGMDETIAAKLCNYTQQRVSQLKADPAFAELLAHYSGQVDDEFADFTSAAAALSIDMLGALQEMLDQHPEKFGPGHLMDAIKLLADRTGHAPVSKSVNINVNTDMAQRLRAAQARRLTAKIIPDDPLE